MTHAQPIAHRTGTVSTSLDLSPSPTTTFHLSPSSFTGDRSGSLGAGGLAGNLAGRVAEKQLQPFDTGDIRILLLENVNEAGRDILTRQGYQVEALKTSLPEDQLIEKIR